MTVEHKLAFLFLYAMSTWIYTSYRVSTLDAELKRIKRRLNKKQFKQLNDE